MSDIELEYEAFVAKAREFYDEKGDFGFLGAMVGINSTVTYKIYSGEKTLAATHTTHDVPIDSAREGAFDLMKTAILDYKTRDNTEQTTPDLERRV